MEKKKQVKQPPKKKEKKGEGVNLMENIHKMRLYQERVRKAGE